MAIYYVDPSGGSDTNDGRDFLGLALSNATYDHTGNGEGERHLSSTSAFASYTFTSGDRIYLMNAVGGVADGLYEIDSKVDDDAILLKANAGLTADSTADVDSSTGPFVSTQKGIDSVSTTSDEIRLCQTAIETVSARIDNDSTISGLEQGTNIHVYSYSSDGTIEEDGYTIQASASIATGILDASSSATVAPAYWKWKGIIFDGNSNAASALYCVGEDPGSYHYFERCQFKNCTSHGCYLQAAWFFLECTFNNNGGCGLSAAAANRGPTTFLYCSFHDNTSHGCYVNGSGLGFFGCLFYNNVIGLLFGSYASNLDIQNCTFYNNSSHGFQNGTAWNDSPRKLINNIFVENGGYGIYWNVATYEGWLFNWDYNCYNNNTSGNCSETIQGDNNLIDVDPLFKSTVTSNEDLHLKHNSPCLSAGLYGSDIGALGWDYVAPAAAGGGTSVIT